MKHFKRSIALVCLTVFMSLSVSSCFVHRFDVGDGSQENIEVKKKNHYLIYGLIPLSTTNPQKMAGGAQNYEIKEKHNVLDIVLQFITAGIYAPTTTIVTK